MFAPRSVCGYETSAVSCEDTGYGMFVRHVKALAIRDMVLTTDKSDARPAFRLQDVAGAEFDGLTVSRRAAPVFTLRRLTDFLLRNSGGLPDARREQVENEAF